MTTKDFKKSKLTRGNVLCFTPYAWAKLLYMRDAGQTEVGGYGITRTEDPLLVTDFMLVKQECTGITVELDEEDSGKFIDEMMDSGIAPWQCQNIWIHTHPGDDPTPSDADEKNFDKNFNHPDWAIFFILAQNDKSYCRIRHNVGAGIEVEISMAIDWYEFPASDKEGWGKEYKEKVTESKWMTSLIGGDMMTKFPGLPSHYLPSDSEEKLQEKFEHDNDIAKAGGNYWDDDEADIDDPGIEIIIDDQGVTTYWDDITDKYYDYTPNEGFWDCDATIENDGKIVLYAPDPEPKWMQEVRVWANIQLKKMKKERQNA